MLKWFKQLDDILRGDPSRLSEMQRGRIDVPIGGLAVVVVVLAAVYGVCVGSYSPIRTGGEGASWMQPVASAVKIPLLFFLTLLITMPSLYVFSALMGSRLTAAEVLRLLAAMTGVMVAVLASLGPIIVFFAISTDHYAFMVLLNVAVGSIGGLLGMVFLIRTLRLLIAPPAPPLPPSPAAPSTTAPREAENPRPAGEEPSAPPTHRPGTPVGAKPWPPREHRRGDGARGVFAIWVFLYALIGAQMSWLLRPFIGHPRLPFEWFRERESNFFIAVLRALREILTG